MPTPETVTPAAAPVPSPCIRNCCLDEDDVCMGCFRSLNEIIAWGSTDDNGKRHILKCAARRKQERARTN